MKSTVSKYTPFAVLITVAGGLAAGAINGILGTGGGIALAYLFSRLRIGDEKDNLACAMAVILPVSVISLFTYGNGHFESFTQIFATAVPAGIGGLAGAVISDKVSTVFIRRLFAVIVIYAGVTMIS